MKKLKLVLFFIIALVLGFCCAAVAACKPDEPEGPSTENPGETPGDTPGGDNPGGDTPGGDNPGGDTPGGDTPGGDTPGGDTPGGETPGGETPGDEYDGLFAGTSHDYALTADYTITEEDIANTDGGEDQISLGYICSFDLGGYTLDLGGAELSITSDAEDVVLFKNGTLVNGSLSIAVPNGDISFEDLTIASTVTYELEAASDTIRFSNSVATGKLTVKSDSRVQINGSALSDITLEGNGNLIAGIGAELGALTVSKNASGASVTVVPGATINSVALNAAANVSVGGAVSSVTVAEQVKEDTAELRIEVASTATVDKLEIGAAADISVAGSVSSVTVAETVKADSGELKIDVAKGANVTKVELNAAASVTVAGSVENVTVAETAAGDSAELKINVSQGAEVEKVELNAPASVDVSGSLNDVVIKNTAGESSVKVNETASVMTIAVAAENTKVESAANANISSVVVSENIQNTDISDTIEVSVVTEKEMEEITRHQHLLVFSSRKEATCTEAGEIVYTCSCGETSKTTIPALGHDEVYSVLRKPTATEEGVGLYTCIRCGHTRQVPIKQTAYLIIDGLEELYALIPDGTYELASDKNDPITLENDGGIITVEEFSFIFEANGGKVRGTLYFKLTNEGGGRKDTMVMSGKTDGSSFYIYAGSTIDSDERYYDTSSYIYATVNGIIKSYILEKTNIDIDEVYGEISAYMQGMDSDANELASAVLKFIADKAFTSAAEGDGTTYTFDKTKFKEALTSLGEMTPAQLIDELFGEKSYEAIAGVADKLGTMKVEELADTIFTAAENFGISEDMLFSLAEFAISTAIGQEIDAEKLIEDSYDLTVPAAVASYISGGNATAEQTDSIKQSIEQYVASIKDICGMKIKEVVTSQMFPMLPFENYDSLLQMVDMYAEGAELSVTLSSDNALTAFSVAYAIDMSGEGQPAPIVTISWEKGQELPQVSVNVAGAIGSVVTDKNGNHTISVEYGGMEATLSYAKTEGGADATLVIGSGEENSVDIALTITDTANGASIDIDGTMDTSLFNIFGGSVSAQPEKPDNGSGGTDSATTEVEVNSVVNVSGTLTAQKTDGTVDMDVWTEHDWLKDIMYEKDFELTNVTEYESTILTMDFTSDDRGDYFDTVIHKYRPGEGVDYVEDGVTYFVGYIVESTYRIRTDSINGLPDMVIMNYEDCGNWIRLDLIPLGQCSYESKEYAGSFIVNEDGSYTPVAVLVTGQSSYETVMTIENSGAYVSCYYNPLNGSFSNESMHEYEYSAKYVSGGSSCEDGLIITKTCKKCGDINRFVYNSHYYESEKIVLPTSCGDSAYLDVSTCIMCGEKDIYLSEGNHYFIKSEFVKNIVEQEDYDNLIEEEFEIRYSEAVNLILSDIYIEVENELYQTYYDELYAEYIKTMTDYDARLAADAKAKEMVGAEAFERAQAQVSEEDVREEAAAYVALHNVSLDKLVGSGLDVNGFYDGSAEILTCANCGLEVAYYTYYTNTTGARSNCFMHTAYVAEYQGSEYFEPFTYYIEKQEHGHSSAAVFPDETEVTLEDVVAKVEGATGEDIPFVPVKFEYIEYKCMGCGMTTQIDAEFYSEIGTSFSVTILYNDISMVESYYYNLESSTPEEVLAEAEKYTSVPFVPAAAHMLLEYDSESKCETLYLNLDSGTGDSLQIDYKLDKQAGEGYMEVIYYNYSACLQTTTVYTYSGGSWAEQETTQNKRHDYSGNERVTSDNCNEDGWFYGGYCLVCGEAYSDGVDIGYEHNYTHFGGTVSATDEKIENKLSVSGLDGMQANVLYEYDCDLCGTLRDVVITLLADWTLTQDVYIRAENVTLDLNGFTVDLSGNNLIIYGYQGGEGYGRVTVTDNTFDTSGIENYDPENFKDYRSKITDSKGTGYFIAFVNGGEVINGTIALESEVFESDCDSRYTIYNTMLDMGSDIAILKDANSFYEYNEELQGAVNAPEGVVVCDLNGFTPFVAGGNGASLQGEGKGYAAIAFEVTLDAGQVFTFDYSVINFNGSIAIYVDGDQYENLYGNMENTFMFTGDMKRTYRVMVICDGYYYEESVVSVSNAAVM